jgi:hypothetical protein
MRSLLVKRRWTLTTSWPSSLRWCSGNGPFSTTGQSACGYNTQLAEFRPGVCRYYKGAHYLANGLAPERTVQARRWWFIRDYMNVTVYFSVPVSSANGTSMSLLKCSLYPSLFMLARWMNNHLKDNPVWPFTVTAHLRLLLHCSNLRCIRKSGIHALLYSCD